MTCPWQALQFLSHLILIKGKNIKHGMASALNGRLTNRTPFNSIHTRFEKLQPLIFTVFFGLLPILKQMMRQKQRSSTFATNTFSEKRIICSGSYKNSSSLSSSSFWSSSSSITLYVIMYHIDKYSLNCKSCC